MAAGNRTSGKLVVAAIDFGTTFSGYAFSFKHHFDRNPLQIYSHNWTDGIGIVSPKTPTTVLFDKNGDFHSFGYEAEKQYAKLSSTNIHTGWKYFRRFKMTLHNKSNLKLNMKLRDDQGNRMIAVKVFSAAISYLKDHLLRKLNEIYSEQTDEDEDESDTNDNCINSNDILWVLTVPAIWSDSGKQFMSTAAIQAGIPKDQLLLALEPEAAAIFCKKSVLSKKKRNTDAIAFQKDSQFMVIDLGGGTVDITVHKVDKDGKFHELYPPSGGPWGGTRVDEKIADFMENLFGERVLKLLKKESTAEELDMLRMLELKKRQFEVADDDDGKVSLTLPSSLYELYERENPNFKFSEKLKQHFQNHVEKRKIGGLLIKQDLFLSMFNESTENLKGHLEKICQREDMKNVKTFVMVGGYAECDVMKRCLKETFRDKRVIIPAEATSAVVKGAVIFGHDPEVIDSRRAPCTYGISTAVPFDNRVHPAAKKHNANCEDVFKIFVPIGTEIIPSKTQVKHTFNSARSTAVEIYKSLSETPSFIDDPGCEKIGEIDIENPGDKPTLIEVIMWFGDTELHVEAKDEGTGNKISAEFKFLR